MNVTSGHWVFAGIFTVVFIIGIAYAYRNDLRQTPELFKGSSKFLLGVVLFIMILVVAKMIHRMGQ
jgi:cytochrome bd-type quinol oxidase subunit 1